MAFPWNAGDTLNAADLNDYAGLVYMKTVTVGSAVTSVGVTGLTGFDAYQFVFDKIDPTTGVLIVVDDFVTLTSALWRTTTTLFNQSGTPAVYTKFNAADGFVGLMDTSTSACTMTVHQLNDAGSNTRFYAMSQYSDGFSIGGGRYAANAAATTLTFKCSSGTMTGGNIHIYGLNT